MQDRSQPANKAGKWRKSLMRASKWTVLVFGALAVVLGSLGFHKCLEGAGLWESLYSAFQLFTVTDGCKSNMNPSLNVARFLAAIVVFYAVIRVLARSFWARINLALQSLIHSKNRYILIGFGALNQEIARELARRGKRLTIVSRDFDAAERDFAASNRAILLERDIALDDAMNWLYLGRCEKIVVACGDDSLTYEVARRLGQKYAELGPGLRRFLPWAKQTPAEPPDPREVVHAHFTSVELHNHALRSRDLGLGRDRMFSGFSIREASARYLMARAWLVERVREARQDRMHLVVFGAGDLGLSITREALQHGCSAGLEPPMITVIDQDGAGARDRFKAAMPRLFDETIPKADRPLFQFRTATAEGIDLTQATNTPAGQIPADKVEARARAFADPVTAWVVCCRDDTRNLTLAMKLESAMRRGILSPAPIFPRQWQANIRNEDNRGLGQADPLHLVAPFGGMDDVVGTLPFLDEDTIEIAQVINNEYLPAIDIMDVEKFKAPLEAYGPPPWREDHRPTDSALRERMERAFRLDQQRFKKKWEEMDDEGRLSNIAPALQASIRVWELGFEWSGRHAGKLPQVQEPYIAMKASLSASEDMETRSLLGQVAKAEHRRWMVERALRGWAAAAPGKRSNALRLHPDFRTFEQLENRSGKEESDLRQLDAAVVRGTLRALEAFKDHPIARPAENTPEIALLDATAIDQSAYRIGLSIPEPPARQRNEDDEAYEKRTEFLARLNKGTEHLVNWISLKTSNSIRLNVESAATLDSPDLRRAISEIHDVALQNNVHMWLDFSDARAERNKIQKTDSDA